MRHKPTTALLLLVAAATAGACKSSSSPSDNPSNGGAPGQTITILAGTAADYNTPGHSGGTGFSPGTLTVALNSQVTWSNNDAVDHSPMSDTGVFSGNASPGGSYKFTFATAGTFPYHCTIHPEMVGTVVVH